MVRTSSSMSRAPCWLCRSLAGRSGRVVWWRQLRRRWHRYQMARTATEPLVDRNQRYTECLCEHDVFRVIGFRPAEGTRQVERSFGLIGHAIESDRQVGEMGDGNPCLIGWHLAAICHLAQDGGDLRREQRRG